MTKIELRNALNYGKCLEDVLTLSWGQECTIFKAEEFKEGDDILYIPDMELNNITYECQDLTTEAIDEILSYCYTGNDFIDCCEGNKRTAKILFSYVDWQHPSSALPEIDGWDFCDRCGVEKEGEMYEVLKDICYCENCFKDYLKENGYENMIDQFISLAAIADNLGIDVIK